jgi:hypothetical protein
MTAAYTPDGFIILNRCDYCYRLRKQRIDGKDYCNYHLFLKLTELEETTGMKLLRVALGDY